MNNTKPTSQKFNAGFFLKGIIFSAMLLMWSGITVTEAVAANQPQSVKKHEVTGVVVDNNGIALPGATISVKGSLSMGGALTDLDGNFAFGVPEGSTLLVQFIGFNDFEMVVNKAVNGLRIVLEEQRNELDEVIVVGYGVQRKESVVGAISQVGSDALENAGTTNLTNALAGKLSGVMTFQESGQPGNNNSTIFIRGLSSWNGSSPLVMVDGVERDFSTIDPNEVQSISVLKDASATAVFGAKGANGVILVTTKTGMVGKPKINFIVNYGVDIPTHTPEHIPSYKVAEMANVAYKNAQRWGSLYSEQQIAEYRNPSTKVNSLRYPDNDWYELLLKDAVPSVNANMNLSGGNKVVKYYMSVGYTHEDSIIRHFSEWHNSKFSYDKINFRSNLDFNITKSTKLSFKVGGDVGINQSPSISALFTKMYAASPMMYNAYFPSWVLEEIPDPDYPEASGERLASSLQAFTGNPYTDLNYSTFEQTTAATLYTDLIFTQNLDFITRGLSITGKASLSTYYERISQQATHTQPNFYIDWNRYDLQDGNPWVHSAVSDEVYEDAPFAVTQGSLKSGYKMTVYWEGAINYHRNFGNHTVSALVLYQQREMASGTGFPYRNQGIVGRVTYDYKHKYLFEGNLGYTGSERFAPTNRFGLFPSIAVGYVISEEKFWKKHLGWWNKFKIRYSDGVVGSDSADQRWLYVSEYSQSSNNNISEDASANLNARWETARKKDLGFEMGWLNNIITLNVELFDEYRKDMLIAPNVTMLVGTSFKNVNRGEMKKHGMEIELGHQQKLKSGFQYNLTAMVGLNENRIVNYEDAPYAPEYQKYAGSAYKAATNGTNIVDSGYYTSIDDIHNYPGFTSNWQSIFPGTFKFLDYKADGKISVEDLHKIQGSQYAPVTYSFGGGFSWKGLAFNILFYGNWGKYVNFNRSYQMEFTKQDLIVHTAQLDYWQPNNQNASHNNMYFDEAMYNWAGGNANTNWDLQLEGHTWRRADYLTLKEVYLGYTFNKKKIKKAIGVNSLTVHCTANNVFTITNLIEGNPQRTSLSSGYYPIMATVKFGVKVGF